MLSEDKASWLEWMEADCGFPQVKVQECVHSSYHEYLSWRGNCSPKRKTFYIKQMDLSCKQTAVCVAFQAFFQEYWLLVSHNLSLPRNCSCHCQRILPRLILCSSSETANIQRSMCKYRDRSLCFYLRQFLKVITAPELFLRITGCCSTTTASQFNFTVQLSFHHFLTGVLTMFSIKLPVYKLLSQNVCQGTEFKYHIYK